VRHLHFEFDAASAVLPHVRGLGKLVPHRLKKFIGMLILVALVVLYALIATTVATYRLAESPWYVHLGFFGFSGVLWVVPAMFVISWMERRPTKSTAPERSDTPS